MAQLPLAQGIDRFKQNEDRMDQFTNGSDTQEFITSGGTPVPTIRKFLKDKNAQINEAADGILVGSEAARNAAQGFANDASDAAGAAQGFANDASDAAGAAQGFASDGQTTLNEMLEVRDNFALRLPATTNATRGKPLVGAPSGDGYSFGEFPANDNMRWVSSRTAMKAAGILSSFIYLNEGKRSGIFELVAGTKPADVQEGVFVSNNTSGYYWRRVYSGMANVLWFGAAANGTGNDAVAIQASLDVTGQAYLPSESQGALLVYRVTNTIAVGASQSVMGDWRRTRITTAFGVPASNLFHITGTYIAISNLHVFDDGTHTGYVFSLRTSEAVCDTIMIDNVNTNSCGGIYADSGGANTITNLFITHCQNLGVRARGLYLTKGFAFIFFTRVTWSYTGISAPSSNVPAVFMSGNQGAIFENCDVLGGVIPGMSSRTGFDIRSSQAVWFRRCMADTMGGFGFNFGACQYFYLNDCVASLCDQHGCYVNTGSTDAHIIGCRFGGRQGLGGSAGQHGLIVETASSVVVNGCIMASNTGRGIATSGSNPSMIASGCHTKGNGAGNYLLTGSFSHVVGLMLASGALVANATGTNG